MAQQNYDKLISKIDTFLAKYKEGIIMPVETPVQTTRGQYNAKRYKKVRLVPEK